MHLTTLRDSLLTNSKFVIFSLVYIESVSIQVFRFQFNFNLLSSFTYWLEHWSAGLACQPPLCCTGSSNMPLPLIIILFLVPVQNIDAVCGNQLLIPTFYTISINDQSTTSTFSTRHCESRRRGSVASKSSWSSSDSWICPTIPYWTSYSTSSFITWNLAWLPSVAS